jgi:FYVE, RhoGEF and PH domain containing 5/6
VTDNTLAPSDTSSLSGFPSWLTITGPGIVASTAEALMAMTQKGSSAVLARIDDCEQEEDTRGERPQHRLSVDLGEGRTRIRAGKEPSRPRSYYEILGDFRSRDDGELVRTDSPLGSEHGTPLVTGSVLDLSSDWAREREREREKEREDTARRHKRFSMPAVALQTTSVLARTGDGFVDGGGFGRERGRRFSLALGKAAGVDASGVTEITERVGMGNGTDLGKGLAAGKLSELLGRQKRVYE